MLATSPLDPAAIGARYEAISKGEAKANKMDDLMTKLAERKRSA
jgi:hypothetical protein